MKNFFAKNLKFFRENKNWSQNELANRTISFCEKHPELKEQGIKPINQSSINRWEKGINFPGIDSVVLLSIVLDVEVSSLISETTDYNREITNAIQIPVFTKINPSNQMDQQKSIIGFIEIQKEWLSGKRDFFALKISDDTMSPKYLINDIVIFEKENNIKAIDKKDCIVIIGSEDAIFRNLTINEAGITLIPLNLNNSNNYQPTFYSNEEIEKLPIKIIGYAIEKRTKL